MSDSPRATAVKRWVWKQKVTPTMRVLLLALADHLNEDSGLAWPALETLAEECCVSRGTVINQIDKAVTAGYITKEARSRKGQLGQTSNGYRFMCWPEPESNSSTLAEYKNDTQVEPEFNSSTDQSTNFAPTRVQKLNDQSTNFAPLEPILKTLSSVDPVSTSSSPSFPSVTSETTTAAAAGAQALCLVLAGQPGFDPSTAFVAKIADKYGHLDLEEEAIKMAGWLKTYRKQHPKKDKPCSTAFVLNWLKGGLEPRGAQHNGHKSPPDEDDANERWPVGLRPEDDARRQQARAGPT